MCGAVCVLKECFQGEKTIFFFHSLYVVGLSSNLNFLLFELIPFQSTLCFERNLNEIFLFDFKDRRETPTPVNGALESSQINMERRERKLEAEQFDCLTLQSMTKHKAFENKYLSKILSAFGEGGKIISFELPSMAMSRSFKGQSTHFNRRCHFSYSTPPRNVKKERKRAVEARKCNSSDCGC